MEMHLRGTWRIAAIIIVGVSVAACARVGANVESFSKLSDSYKGKTVAISAYKEQDPSSLEWQSYAGRLEQKLVETGFVLHSNPKTSPDYLVFFGYGIDKGENVQTAYSIPQYGVTGYSSAYSTGTVSSFGGTSVYSGTTTLVPQYGITGFSQGSSSRTVYTRSLSIDVIDARKNDRVWQSSLASRGKCGVISEVIDELFEISFKSFPRANSGRETVAAKADC